MTDDNNLEMRVTELEDKHGNLNFSAEEMATYQKVAAAISGAGGHAAACVAAIPACVHAQAACVAAAPACVHAHLVCVNAAPACV